MKFFVGAMAITAGAILTGIAWNDTITQFWRALTLPPPEHH